MTYELAKELTDAGFSQEGFGMHWNGSVFTTQDIEGVYAPTLSELIEACGDRFQNVNLTSGLMSMRNKETLFWEACAYIKGETYTTWQNEDCKYSSPEEAIANLWLALNKK